MFKQILLVGLGGGLGSIFRYLTSVLITGRCSGSFPLATFIVNISGCFLIGLLVGWSGKAGIVNNELKILLITGFCGGYTTFSAFAAENMKLLSEGNYAIGATYIAVSVLIGLATFWFGHFLTKIL